ncbi:MAG TPA: UvrD-helicase domain-containing protein, partial [Actinomycetota bacterium]|nr:UvrD-helicase domain-containing protein [Actinomycetota bacterium]
MSVTSPLLEGLNDIQRQAVLQIEGPVLIVAGAGSGKTRALTHRIAYLIRECGVAPGQILAITFTNKASREMAERVGGLLGGPISKGMWILTFHSACARILRREHTHLGVPSNFTIYDDGDTERLIAGIERDTNVDAKRFPPKAIAAAISKAKDRVIGAKEFAEMASSFYEETVARMYEAYEQRKRAAGALDFDDLITETVRLFREHPAVLEHYQERFRHILVDEYQDTSRAQYQLVNQLAAKYRNICVVGDADQGVYSWRGATIQNILDFERDYPDAAVFLMEQNYRSTQNILAVANALIENNVQRKPKNLWTEAGSGDPVVRVRADDEHGEAYFVVQEIERLRETEGFRYRDVAIFYRTNAQSRVIEDVMMRVGMPYRVFGGVRFYQRKEIKDILAYLRLLTNPQDVISFRRVVNTPKRGIGDATVAAVEGFARDMGIDVVEACRRVDEIPTLAARAKGAVAGFTQIMTTLGHHFAEGAGPARMVEFAGTESGYLAELEDERTVEAQGRIENLQELSGVAAELIARDPDAGLDQFLEQVSLIGEQDEYDEEESSVTLMTLHIAKGLEFP